MPIWKKETWIPSHDDDHRIKIFKTAFDRINDELLVLKKQYEEKVRNGTIELQKSYLKAYLLPLLNKKEELYKELEAEKNQANFREVLKSNTFLEYHYFIPLRQRLDQFTSIAETDYFKINPELISMPEYLSEMIYSYKTHAQNFKNATPDTRNGAWGAAHIENCKKDLLYLQVYLAQPNLIECFSDIQLISIARTHNNSSINLLVGREALRRANQNIFYFDLATEMLSYADAKEGVVSFESEIDKEKNNKALADEISQFKAQQTDSTYKCQLIKATIIVQLENSCGSTPWKLGWLGSRYKIEHEGEIYSVPQGIYELYHLADNAEQDIEQIQLLIAEKTTPVSPIYSFFSSILGNARSQETQKTYDEFKSILGSLPAALPLS